MADVVLKIIYQIHDLSYTCLDDTIPSGENTFTHCRQHWRTKQNSEWVVSGPPGTHVLTSTDMPLILWKKRKMNTREVQTRRTTETDIQRQETWLPDQCAYLYYHITISFSIIQKNGISSFDMLSFSSTTSNNKCKIETRLSPIDGNSILPLK